MKVKYLEIDEDVNVFNRGLVYGVGIDDISGSKEWEVDGKRYSEKYYCTWKNMLKRCYFSGGEYLGKVVVDKSWHTLSNFKIWFDKNYVEGYSLDKDILGGKIYSETTCLFIPQKLNTFIKDVAFPCGSYYEKARGKYQSYTKAFGGKRINIGRFNTESEAIFYAKTVKILEINRIIENVPLQPKVISGLYMLLDDMYARFVLPRITQVGNCTFLDTGGCFKKYGNGYDLSIVKLYYYC